MELQPAFPGIVQDDGGLLIDQIKKFHDYLKYNLRGKRVRVIVEEVFPDKTPNQNAFFHGVVVPFIAKLAGYNPSYRPDLLLVREALKNDFGPKVEVISFKTGAVELQPKSIADYTVEDFIMLIDGSNLYSVDMGYGSLPKPETVKYDRGYR